MSSQLLFECLSEEIPSRMQNSAAIQMKNHISNALNKNNVKFTSIEVFITSRRITLFVDGISPLETKNSDNAIKGPKVSAAQSALDGFLRKNKKKEADLFVRKVNGEDFYFIKKDSCQFSIEEVLKNQLEEMLRNFSWPKSMRWGEKKERWVRPIKNILCILNRPLAEPVYDEKFLGESQISTAEYSNVFEERNQVSTTKLPSEIELCKGSNGEVIPVSFAGITASNITYGHRFLCDNSAFSVKEPKDYFEFLEKNNVILQPDKRKQFILDQLDKFTKEQDLQLEKNDYLLNELTGLVEWPIVLFGKVNQEKSAELPKEVILSIIHTQQKYLALSREQKILYFATVVNVNNEQVIKGHEKILEARLADAQFLISQDKKCGSLDYYVSKLDSILFHASLGSVGEKVKRITALSKYIAICIPRASLIKVERAAHLAKADLATSIVREFPELQGVMGGYYATCFQEDKEISEAIIEHYKPIGQEQECPKSSSAVAVSIADKIDSLVGLIAASEKISGSYDQFGLRRMAIGIIRTMLENNLNISIKLLIDKSVSLYSRSVFTKDLASTDQPNKLNRKKVSELVLKFCLERFKVILKKKNIRQDIIDSILYKVDIEDFFTAEKQAVILDRYLSTSRGEDILGIYKRISNIISKVEKSNGSTCSISYSKRFLIENEETALSNSAIAVHENIKQAIKNNHLNAALDELAGFVPFINQFMDNVKINCDSEELRRNRLCLLAYIISIFHLVADFSLIQVKQWAIS
ncbi:MAG: Glycine--tRNA ligase beta subunit [Wolbachia endosymbiont of Ctenocephalides orientis wCori]|nr:MAG: Glycine--tRNA ligase beta subunit [Wolbachia endosymbiont of Ctenocephalides orientis wCori]